MKNFKSHFKFNKQERSGIFFLLLLIIIIQGTYFYIKVNPPSTSENLVLDTLEQARVDSLKLLAKSKDSIKIYPFNPNFITDYKGYTLGLSVDEIDRLHAYRNLNKYVNSKEEFQSVTKVSDSVLQAISPYFKFPDWVTTTRKQFPKEAVKQVKKKPALKIKDINSVTAAQLKTISGIGDKLSARIIKFRDRLGGFLVNEQLYDVYGLDREIANNALKEFQVLSPPNINPININTATVQEMAQLIYISYPVANRIVEFRVVNGGIKSFEELTKIEDFPSEKLERIALYLSL